MIFLLIPFFLFELYFSLKVGESIGFFFSVIWIVLSFALGIVLLRRSPLAMMGNIKAMREGKVDIRGFQNASMAYLIAAVLLIVPGVFSDFLGLAALGYSFYLQFIAIITPKERYPNFKKQGDENVIDVEIIDEYGSDEHRA